MKVTDKEALEMTIAIVHQMSESTIIMVGQRSYTKYDLYREVINQTDFGKQMVQVQKRFVEEWY